MFPHKREILGIDFPPPFFIIPELAVILQSCGVAESGQTKGQSICSHNAELLYEIHSHKRYLMASSLDCFETRLVKATKETAMITKLSAYIQGQNATEYL